MHPVLGHVGEQQCAVFPADPCRPLGPGEALCESLDARVGILPGWGLSQKLSRLIGIYRARELSLSGNFLDAETAERWGLVNRVVPPDDLLPTAIKLAQDMAGVDAAMVQSYKALINDGFARSFGDGLALEHAVSSAANGQVSAEAVEARRKAVMERGRTQ